MRIGIIGHFGGKEKFNDGQTVKTITLYDAMMRRKPEGVEIDRIDTYYIKHNPIKFVGQMIKVFLRDKKIVVLLSQKGRTVLFPILHYAAKMWKKEVYHYAIGGQLGNEVKSDKKWCKYIMSFHGNWMESRELVNTLKGLGVHNAKYIPNFKSLSIINEDDLVYSGEAPFRFCTFSRVMPEKGIEDAMNAMNEINHRAGKKEAELVIYGPIEKGYEDRFNELVKANMYTTYGGLVPANESVEVLKNFYMLLFPTYWKGEGMPGTVIDAYSAGIPIIARWWPVCDELIEDGVTGFVYPANEPEQLNTVIEKAIRNPKIVSSMKTNCLKKANTYSENTVMQSIANEMQIPFK